MTTLAELDWPLRTERLLLRPVRAVDTDPLYAYWRLPEVYEWTGAEPVDREAFGARLVEPDRLARSLVVESSAGAVVGDLMVRVGDGWAQPEVADGARGVEAELGWVFDPAYGGRGLATEAVRAVLGVCFDGLGLRRVVAECFAANLASARLMGRVGMRLETRARENSLHRSGKWLDGLGYALLASEWRASRAPT